MPVTTETANTNPSYNAKCAAGFDQSGNGNNLPGYSEARFKLAERISIELAARANDGISITTDDACAWIYAVISEYENAKN